MNKKWFQRKKNDALHDDVWATYQTIKTDTVALRQQQERSLRTYTNVDAINNPYMQTDPFAGLTRNISINVIQSIVDTLVSKIGSVKPGIQFVSNGADYTKRTSIKDLNDFIYALFRAAKIYETGRMVFKDSCLFGTGFLKPYRKGNSIAVERVLPAQLFVDHFDGLYGKPTQMFQSKFVNKSVVENLFKKKVESQSVAFQSTDVVDLLEVVEAWYLSEDAHKRRHVISTRDVTLLDEEYPCPHEPIQALHFNRKPIGYWGAGAVEPLIGIQREINKVVSMIERAIHVGSNVWAMVPSNSGVTEEAFSNRRGRLPVITYKGQTPPHLQTFNAIAPELFRYLEQLEEKAYNLSGISQMSATGKKQPGITSGVAIRTVLDIESQRFTELELCLHEFYSRVAKHSIWLCNEISENEDVEIAFPDEDTFRSINWKDIDLDDDAYEITDHAVSVFGHTPEGKLERLSELAKNGLISPDEARRLMDMPDLKHFTDLQDAAKKIIEENVEKILTGQEYLEPTKYDDLAYGLQYAVQRYNLARLKGQLTEDTEENLLQYISSLEDLMAEMAPPQPPTQPEGDIPPQ